MTHGNYFVYLFCSGINYKTQLNVVDCFVFECLISQQSLKKRLVVQTLLDLFSVVRVLQTDIVYV